MYSLRSASIECGAGSGAKRDNFTVLRVKFMTTEEARDQLKSALQGLTLEQIHRAHEAIVALHQLREVHLFTASPAEITRALDTLRQLLIDLDPHGRRPN
jgi:hypothetical protein